MSLITGLNRFTLLGIFIVVVVVVLGYLPDLDSAPLTCVLVFVGNFSWMLVVLSPKIGINLPRTYEKLHCKVEPYRFSNYQNLKLQTGIQRSWYFIKRRCVFAKMTASADVKICGNKLTPKTLIVIKGNCNA